MATKELRRLGYQNLIVGLTGNVEEEDIQNFLEAGADLVLAKPLKLEQFDALLAFLTHFGPESYSKQMKTISFVERMTMDLTYEWIPRDAWAT
jgi:CheY-like chemotaxis protein